MDLKETIEILELHNAVANKEYVAHPDLHKVQFKLKDAISSALSLLKKKQQEEENIEKALEEFHKQPWQFVPAEPKITLRDHFAGLAMQTLLNSYLNQSSVFNTIWNQQGNILVDDFIKTSSYKMADEMIKERGKTNKTTNDTTKH